MSTNTRPSITVQPDPKCKTLYAVYVNDVPVRDHRYLSKHEATWIAAEMRKLLRKGQREAWAPRHTRPTPIIDPPPPTDEALFAMRMAERDHERKEASYAKHAKRRRREAK